jgi:hypothetical protein
MPQIGAVIRVFGIYTHAQLDKRLWDSMGCQLSRKGKEYQRRYASSAADRCTPDLPYCSCAFRADPVHKGDKVLPPASFPPMPLLDPKMIPEELPTVSDEVLEKVCQNLISDSYLLISA